MVTGKIRALSAAMATISDNRPAGSDRLPPGRQTRIYQFMESLHNSIHGIVQVAKQNCDFVLLANSMT